MLYYQKVPTEITMAGTAHIVLMYGFVMKSSHTSFTAKIHLSHVDILLGLLKLMNSFLAPNSNQTKAKMKRKKEWIVALLLLRISFCFSLSLSNSIWLRNAN